MACDWIDLNPVEIFGSVSLLIRQLLDLCPFAANDQALLRVGEINFSLYPILMFTWLAYSLFASLFGAHHQFACYLAICASIH